MTNVARSLSVVAVLAATLPVANALAQAPPAADGVSPRISLVQPGANRLLEDLEYLLSLTTPEEQKQWETIEEFFEQIFLLGIDRERPVRIDTIVGDGPTRYRPSFPIADRPDFLQNLGAFGIDRRRLDPDFYQLRGDFKGYLRFKDAYGTIAETREDVPPTLPDPLAAIGGLLAGDYDLSAELVNQQTDAAAVEARRENFQEQVIDELLAGIGRMEDESKEEYDLRKLGIAQQLEELQRYYVETAGATIGWTTDVQSGRGRGELRLEPIAETDLAQAVQLLDGEPSHFANVPRAENPVLGLRIDHPLDPMRKRHLDEFFTQLAPVLKNRAEEDADKTDAEKTAAKKLVDQVVEVLKASAAAGLADGFVKVTRANGDAHLGLAGARVANGKAIDEIVKLLPEANAKIQIKTDVETVGDVTVHEVTVPPTALPDFQFLFGDTSTVYVGTSKEAVWFAAGPGALAALKETIPLVEKPAEAATDAPFVDLTMQLRPWLELRARAAEEGEGDPELRNLVLEGLNTEDDRLELALNREGEIVTGRLSVQQGLLRVAGKLMAKFSKENLQ